MRLLAMRGSSAVFTTRSKAALVLVAISICSGPTLADEGGVSFWLPGTYGSLAATPQQPGWAIGTIYYHTSVGASGSVAGAREVTIGRLKPTVTVDLNANLHANADLVLVNPSYVFAQPLFGGRLSLGVIGIVGRSHTSLDGTITAGVAGFSTTRSGSIDSSVSGFGDLYPKATLSWNMGVHNFMTYLTGDIPVGSYDSTRLANLGIGHGAIDAGAGYTYFNPQTGFEVSAVTGITYNLENASTDYQNGVDWHLDWGMSEFLSKQFHVGAVGYFYDQLTADRGAAPFLGDNKSSVVAVGPQIGYIFPAGDHQGYLNLKGYYEFEAERRTRGWNVWLTFAISPAPPAVARR